MAICALFCSTVKRGFLTTTTTIIIITTTIII